MRAARQYVDGLWLVDGDPRLAWIKLLSALEVAANRYDAARHGSTLAQLKRHRRRLWKKLEALPAEVQEGIAAELSGTFNVQQKLLSFVKAFDPGPPPVRPAAGFQIQWDELQNAVATIYEHRSRDLHDGIAFPWASCQPPRPLDDDGIPPEGFWGLGVSGARGVLERGVAANLPSHVCARCGRGAPQLVVAARARSDRGTGLTVVNPGRRRPRPYLSRRSTVRASSCADPTASEA